MHRSPRELRGLYEVWEDQSVWSARELVVDGESVDATLWASPSGEWCAVARTEERRVHLAGFGLDLKELHVAPVQDWQPYGLSRDHPQLASTIDRLAVRVLPAWESSDSGT